MSIGSLIELARMIASVAEVIAEAAANVTRDVRDAINGDDDGDRRRDELLAQLERSHVAVKRTLDAFKAGDAAIAKDANPLNATVYPTDDLFNAAMRSFLARQAICVELGRHDDGAHCEHCADGAK